MFCYLKKLFKSGPNITPFILFVSDNLSKSVTENDCIGLKNNSWFKMAYKSAINITCDEETRCFLGSLIDDISNVYSPSYPKLSDEIICRYYAEYPCIKDIDEQQVAALQEISINNKNKYALIREI